MPKYQNGWLYATNNWGTTISKIIANESYLSRQSELF